MNLNFVFLLNILKINVESRRCSNYDRIVHFGDSYILFRFVSGNLEDRTRGYSMKPHSLEINIHTHLEYFSFGWNLKAEFGGDLIFVQRRSSKKGSRWLFSVR